MNTDICHKNHVIKESRAVPIDLEFDQYLFEVYIIDRIENEILRMMEHCDVKSSHCTTPL
jgi:hypothetical protein